MRESTVLRDVMRLGVGALRLFRNNVGKLQDRFGVWIAYGLCPGSSDAIGWYTVTITPEMVGRKVAVFTAFECKSEKGRLSISQRLFLSAVARAGGIAACVRSEDEARAALAYPIGSSSTNGNGTKVSG